MIQRYPAVSRYSVKNDWLESNLSFSFGEYYDEENIHFGPLRVFNDDTVQPGKGFGIHPHREAEIVSIVLKGQLKHEDSLGNSGILQFGNVQRMTAGTGLLHSEVNPSLEEEVSFLQLWFKSTEKQLPPSYEDITYNPDDMRNKLLPIVSAVPTNGEAKIYSDVTLYLSKLDAEEEIFYQQEQGRKMYVFVIDGELVLNNDVVIGKRDSARITELDELTLKSTKETFFLLIDLGGA
ncbi:pirin family protein [Fredinandcohnia sp. QZ13]|uniref:pirin family protein n=1 Tax=Fredinandcohnia sp. QZ13 TaxID=3073144 RepID=UPI00285345C0|nr:pirin family protein [Fredinandcohnia sp. QZ13]MDR4888325.1 pirin family protein [Fredinandcohnia sp. QZ13]